MVQDTSTYYVWIGGSCDYGHKERAGGAAVVIEHNGNIISRDVISDLHTTEFRMMLTLMVKVMQEIPEGSDILFLTNAAYIQNFDKTPTAKSANPDLIIQCIEEKKRHNSVGVKIVQYHKSPLLIETHDRATEAMAKTRKEFSGISVGNKLMNKSCFLAISSSIRTESKLFYKISYFGYIIQILYLYFIICSTQVFILIQK